jgi:ABC-2 type transport system permease protein
MDLPLFNALKPYIFTSHMLGWKGFFDNPIIYQSVFRSASILLLHILIFTSAAVLIFNRKDILS